MTHMEAIESIQNELSESINQIERYIGNSEQYDDCAACYVEGMEHAIEYLDNLVWLVSDICEDAKYGEIKTRIVTVSEKQLKLFESE